MRAHLLQQAGDFLRFPATTFSPELPGWEWRKRAYSIDLRRCDILKFRAETPYYVSLATSITHKRNRARRNRTKELHILRFREPTRET
jgi:hypothetical protein